MKRIPVSGGLLVFLGAAFWSLNSPLVKYLSLDSVLICGLRSLIAAIVLAVTIRPKQLKWNWWMVIYMCSYAGLCLSIILALGATSAPVAIGMQYTAAIWLFLANLLKTRKFHTRAFVPVAIIFIGVVCFMCSGGDAASQTGNFIALSEGIFFALMTVSAKKSRRYQPNWPYRCSKSIYRNRRISAFSRNAGEDIRYDKYGLDNYAGIGNPTDWSRLCLL